MLNRDVKSKMVYKQQWHYSNSAKQKQPENSYVFLPPSLCHYHYHHHTNFATSIQVDEVAPQFSNDRTDARIYTIFGIVCLSSVYFWEQIV